MSNLKRQKENIVGGGEANSSSSLRQRMSDVRNEAEKMDNKQSYGVLFDVDGTLLDTYKILEDCFHKAYKTVFGHDGSFDKFASTIGQPLTEQLWLYTDDPNVHDRLLETYRTINSSLKDEGQPFSGITDVLKILRRDRYPIGVVTSKLFKTAHRTLRKAGIEDCFDCVVGADETAHGKPSPEPVLLGAKRLRRPPEQCIYIGDSPFDLESGISAGAKTIAVAWGQHSLDLLAAEHPDAVADRPQDLPHIINELSHS